ncbi:hypothetical protein HMPREF1390_05826 [Staphylococcus epidermidis NIH08001]|uniref:hypothetical protein n=1 Tax=Staphylococcus epidermidis TaxID=1282 RepID=UPI00026C0322|nr:hypothetical protein [Staphylococcus epidermidis]EJE32937.1 hypothetical protein HMPREF1390_05826 [Staphylococcus epidermidis NIH08001]
MAKDPKFVVHGSQVQKWTDDIQQLKQERDSLLKQRDELINDMAETKRKARAFEEIKANLSHVLDLKKHETLDYKDCKVLREIFKETEDELECD